MRGTTAQCKKNTALADLHLLERPTEDTSPTQEVKPSAKRIARGPQSTIYVKLTAAKLQQQGGR